MRLKNIIYVAFVLCTWVYSVAAQPRVGYQQKGRASYYAPKFQGRKTASGERFSNRAMTAAHPRLPFHTMVRVTNPANGKSCIVRITDRGPHARKRIIDLSKAAAHKLGIVQRGSAVVKLEVIGFDGKINELSAGDERLAAESTEKDGDGNPKKKIESQTIGFAPEYQPAPENSSTPQKPPVATQLSPLAPMVANKSYSAAGAEQSPRGFGVQVGSFESFESAKEAAKSLVSARIEEVYIQVIKENGAQIYRVMAGAFANRQIAKDFCTVVQKAGYQALVKKHLE